MQKSLGRHAPHKMQIQIPSKQHIFFENKIFNDPIISSKLQEIQIDTRKSHSKISKSLHFFAKNQTRTTTRCRPYRYSQDRIFYLEIQQELKVMISEYEKQIGQLSLDQACKMKEKMLTFLLDKFLVKKMKENCSEGRFLRTVLLSIFDLIHNLTSKLCQYLSMKEKQQLSQIIELHHKYQELNKNLQNKYESKNKQMDEVFCFMKLLVGKMRMYKREVKKLTQYLKIGADKINEFRTNFLEIQIQMINMVMENQNLDEETAKQYVKKKLSLTADKKKTFKILPTKKQFKKELKEAKTDSIHNGKYVQDFYECFQQNLTKNNDEQLFKIIGLMIDAILDGDKPEPISYSIFDEKLINDSENENYLDKATDMQGFIKQYQMNKGTNFGQSDKLFMEFSKTKAVQTTQHLKEHKKTHQIGIQFNSKQIFKTKFCIQKTFVFQFHFQNPEKHKKEKKKLRFVESPKLVKRMKSSYHIKDFDSERLSDNISEQNSTNQFFGSKSSFKSIRAKNSKLKRIKTLNHLAKKNDSQSLLKKEDEQKNLRKSRKMIELKKKTINQSKSQNKIMFCNQQLVDDHQISINQFSSDHLNEFMFGSKNPLVSLQNIQFQKDSHQLIQNSSVKKQTRQDLHSITQHKSKKQVHLSSQAFLKISHSEIEEEQQQQHKPNQFRQTKNFHRNTNSKSILKKMNPRSSIDSVKMKQNRKTISSQIKGVRMSSQSKNWKSEKKKSNEGKTHKRFAKSLKYKRGELQSKLGSCVFKEQNDQIFTERKLGEQKEEEIILNSEEVSNLINSQFLKIAARQTKMGLNTNRIFQMCQVINRVITLIDNDCEKNVEGDNCLDYFLVIIKQTSRNKNCNQIKKTVTTFMKQLYFFRKKNMTLKIFLHLMGYSENGQKIQLFSKQNLFLLVYLFKKLSRKHNKYFKLNSLVFDFENFSQNCFKILDILEFEEDVSSALHAYFDSIIQCKKNLKSGTSFLELCLEISNFILKKQAMFVNTLKPFLQYVSSKIITIQNLFRLFLELHFFSKKVQQHIMHRFKTNFQQKQEIALSDFSYFCFKSGIHDFYRLHFKIISIFKIGQNQGYFVKPPKTGFKLMSMSEEARKTALTILKVEQERTIPSIIWQSTIEKSFLTLLYLKEYESIFQKQFEQIIGRDLFELNKIKFQIKSI